MTPRGPVAVLGTMVLQAAGVAGVEIRGAMVWHSECTAFSNKPTREIATHHKPAALFVLALVATLGCTSMKKPEIVSTGPNAFLLSRASKVMGWGNLGEMKAEVYREAKAFAEKQGKVAVEISTKEAPVAFGHYAFFELRFRLADPGEVTAVAGSSIPADPQAVPTGAGTEKKLEDLKALLAKGLITQDDFNQKKKEILAQMWEWPLVEHPAHGGRGDQHRDATATTKS